MASLEQRTGNYNIVFRFGGRKFTRSLGTDDAREADRLRANLEQTIRDVKSGRLQIPTEADVPTFLLSDGKLTQIPDADERRQKVERTRLSLRDLFHEFFTSIPGEALEASTISQMQTHRNNLLRVLGEDIVAENINLTALDAYARTRTNEPGLRGRTIGAATIKKELVTLRRVWRWGRKRNRVATDIPEIRDVELPKTTETPPFQTWAEITTQIAVDDLSKGEEMCLWESLYLRAPEIEELLEYVKTNARHAFLYPMIVTAAHTGARRSELMRSRTTDIRDDVLIIREKKRQMGRESTRRVPMSTLLQTTLSEWLKQHPGGRHTFGMTEDDSQSGRTTIRPLSRDQTNDQFQRLMADSRWQVIRGWHCLRHSFISNLASHGIDQRLIDDFVGHTTEEMRRRYRHLFPEVKQAAIRSVFG